VANKFINKPTIIEAILFDGTIDSELSVRTDFGIDAILHFTRRGPIMVLQTRSGEQHVKPGYWIIRGVGGEIYTCDNESFTDTYEAI